MIVELEGERLSTFVLADEFRNVTIIAIDRCV